MPGNFIVFGEWLPCLIMLINRATHSSHLTYNIC